MSTHNTVFMRNKKKMLHYCQQIFLLKKSSVKAKTSIDDCMKRRLTSLIDDRCLHTTF